MHAINRRKALTVVASVPAIATLAAMPAVASAGEDAELRKLWEKLKAERAECDRLLKVNTAAVDAAWDEYAQRWDFHDIEHSPARAVFICRQRDTLKVVPLKAKTTIAKGPRHKRSQRASRPSMRRAERRPIDATRSTPPRKPGTVASIA